MPSYDCDLFVIGAGSGGVRASRVAAQLGARVILAEESSLGGTCVNRGCVPKKLFVYAAQYRHALANAGAFGWDISSTQINWQRLRDNKNQEVARLNQVYRQLLLDAGVRLVESKATLIDSHSVQVGETVYSAERILLAVGGWPQVPEFPGSEYAITSNEAFFLDALPKRIVLVGGGYIGVEFAGIFNGLGVETHLCHRGDMLLAGFDDDLRRFVADEMTKQGVHIHLNASIQRIEKVADNQLTATAEDGRQWLAEQVMYATGRRPRIDGLGLENTAVVTNPNGSVQVNDFFQTAEPSIYALGDVVGRKALTPVAVAEGENLARHLFAGKEKVLDYSKIPTAVFCQPGLASVGLTEAQARKEYAQVDVYQTRFKPMQYSLTDNHEKVLMKILVDRASDRVIGCHMVGPDAAEIIQALAIAMSANATKADFDRTLGIHPTLAEEFVSLRQPVS